VPSGLRALAYAATAFALVAAFVCAAHAMGFEAISDDDYCRVTIAQRFAVEPRLDATGTSWLPSPFWLLGTVFMASGRTLAVARIAAPTLAAFALLPWLVALRRDPARAIAALALALAVDWVSWVAAAPVPESLVGPMIAAPFLADEDDTPWLFVPFVAVATLARYEAWPMAAVLSAILARRKRPGAALVTFAGPLAWLAWNARAHGDPLHFSSRVARYATAHGHPVSAADALLVYPRALVGDGRPILVLLALLAVSTSARASRDLAESSPRRSGPPLIAATALLAFLEVGSLRGGAPTHHAVRALLPLVWLAAPLVVEALPRRRAGAFTAAAIAIVAASGRFATPPDTGEAVREALRIGREAREEGVATLRLTSCGFEHFAAMAAFGAPERVRVFASAAGAPCPARIAEEGEAESPELR
jgi:hypothetical protein